MLLKNFFKTRELSIVGAVVLIAIFFVLLAPHFGSITNIQDIGSETAMLAILAAAETPVILTRNVDISVAAIVGMTAFITAQLLSDGFIKNSLESLLMALIVGAILGLINGTVVVVGRVPAIIATLGTDSIFRGLLIVISRGQQIYPSQIPPAIPDIFSITVLGIPSFVLIAVAVLIPGAFLMRYIPALRELYAVGSNPAGAQSVGIPVGRRILLAFILCGLLSGLVGFLFVSRFASVASNAASGMELTAIAAAVVGGVSLFGGSGSLVGAMLGALILSILPNGLALMNVSEFIQLILQGALIVGATAVHTALSGRLSRTKVTQLAPSIAAGKAGKKVEVRNE